jgi:hypothetical protein
MLGFPLGILSAAGAGGVAVAPDYELITSTILGTTTSSVTFSNLADYSSTYKHLQIRLVSRSTRSGQTDSTLDFRFNGVTSGYFWHSLRGNGSSVISEASTSQAQMRLGYSTANNSAASAFGATVVDILDSYSTTKNKTFRGFSGTTNGDFVVLTSGSLANTNSITSITVFDLFGNFATGSRFSLYGIR